MNNSKIYKRIIGKDARMISVMVMGVIFGVLLVLVTVCFREDTMKTMGLPNYDRPMTIGNAVPQTENYVHLIMYDGTHFRGQCNQMVFDTIKAHMQSVNPGCRFGKEKVE